MRLPIIAATALLYGVLALAIPAELPTRDATTAVLPREHDVRGENLALEKRYKGSFPHKVRCWWYCHTDGAICPSDCN